MSKNFIETFTEELATVISDNTSKKQIKGLLKLPEADLERVLGTFYDSIEDKVKQMFIKAFIKILKGRYEI